MDVLTAEGWFLRYCKNISFTACIAAANSNRTPVSPDQTWETFVSVTKLVSQLCSFVLQLEFIVRLTQSEHGGPFFGIICLAKPICSRFFRRSLFPNGRPRHLSLGIVVLKCIMAAWICFANNDHYIRLRSLQALTDPNYRQDIVTGDLSSYIVAGKFHVRAQYSLI